MPKKRKKKVSGLCRQCMKAIALGPVAGIKHYELNHPLMPEACYEAYADTWDPTLTRLVRGFVQQYAEASSLRDEIVELKRKIASGEAKNNSLVTRLNMVILALEQGQPK